MKTIRTLIVAALVVGCAGVALGGEKDPKSADRVVYDKLVREISRANQSLSKAYGKALAEARQNQGEVPNELRAEVLSLREQIDRKSIRLTLVAGRHGWPVPETLPAWNGKTEQEVVNEDLRLLLPKDPVIVGALSRQARVLAAEVFLPITPVVSSGRGS